MKFDSKFEEKVWAAARRKRTEYHPKPFPYTIERKYTSDFLVKTKSNKKIYIETKGYFTSADRSKLLNVRKHHPGLDLRLVFMAASNKLNKNSKTTYAEWCNKNGFKWAASFIPEEWYDE